MPVYKIIPFVINSPYVTRITITIAKTAISFFAGIIRLVNTFIFLEVVIISIIISYLVIIYKH